MKRLITTALAVAAMAGCNKENEITPTCDDNATATFASSQIESRVSLSGTKWVYGDQIGISMYDVDSTSSAESLSDENANNLYQCITEEEYTANDDGSYVGAEASSVTFSPTGDPFRFHDNDKENFYAYYPYQAGVSSDATFAADMSDQSSADFMIATSGVTDRESPTQRLTFKHKLAKFTVKVSCIGNVVDLSGLKTTILGVNTTGEYSILDGSQSGALSGDDQKVTFTEVSNNKDAETNIITEMTLSAILLPETVSEDIPVTFTIGTQQYVIKIANGTEIEAGYNHTYKVAIGQYYPYFTNVTIEDWDDSPEPDSLYSKKQTD